MYNERIDIDTSPRQSITLYDLLRMVRGTLESRFSEPQWVSAEISELKLNRSGHCYLNLVEKGDSDGKPRAEARAVIWRTAYNSIATMFQSATGTPLASGIGVLVRVVVTYHEVYGFSLQIIDLDPSYTLGEVERRRRQTIARLEADGVWDLNHELRLPRPTLRIAIVSSATAAGLQDFMRELRRSPYRFSTTLFESLMQGDAAEQSIVDALTAIAAQEEMFDVVVIIRGGGSKSDLALFDSYRIASHVAQFPLPILTGIGHDKDTSVVDMVAHMQCKTPTAVATTLVEMADVELGLLERLIADINTRATRQIGSEELRLQQYRTEVYSLAIEATHRALRELERTEMAIYNEATSRLEAELQRIISAQHLVETYSVDNILKLGFATLRRGTTYITCAGDADIGDSIDIELRDGRITAEVRDIQRDSNVE